MSELAGRVVAFEASPATGREARTFVTEFLIDCGQSDLVDDARQCVSELATNAVLHTRRPYEVAIRPAGDGVRIDVIDRRPAELPSLMPLAGSAADLTLESTTGRGLGIVAAVALRWGISTSPTAKFVWAEIGSATPSAPTAPILALGYSPDASPDDFVFRLENLPVRAAVASGIQVDDLIREIQLGRLDEAAGDDELSRLDELLDTSAGVRLAGRHAALQAAAAGRLRFDLTFSSPLEGVMAIASLRELLASLPARQSPAAAAVPTESVLTFREWVQDEVVAQLGGAAPTRCSLPD